MEETTEIQTFDGFGLRPELLKAISDVGYETPSPIQLKTIPVMLAGRDLIGQAQTGTGKTAAFALPILNQLDLESGELQAMVLTPTRELAIQVAEAFHTYAKHLGRIRVLPVYGGQPISAQIRHLRSGVQVIVGTPGRVMDHIRRETIDLSALSMVALDEADEMLRMGFQEDVEWILAHTPEGRRTALFSATMPPAVKRIASKYLNDPVNIEIERKTLTVPNVSQFYINLSEAQKTEALTRILEAESVSGEAVLIFHRTKVGAAGLTEKLQARGYAAEAMHGDMSQNQRESVIKRLRNGQVEIVVATDVAARGLDVDNITSVINYDMPSDTESYVHRIGRTGRAGRSGKAILFVTPRQQRMKRDVEHYTRQTIAPMKVPSQSDVVARRMALAKERIIKTLTEEELDLYLSLVAEVAEESGADTAEIAAAALRLAAGDRPLEVEVEPSVSEQSYAEDGMVRLFIDVGRNHRVSPGDIVGAIANEGNVPGKAIGAIDVNDRFTLVDIPLEFVDQVVNGMRHTRIRNQRANIRRAAGHDVPENRPRRSEPFRSPRSSERPRFADRPKRLERFERPDRPDHAERPNRIEPAEPEFRPDGHADRIRAAAVSSGFRDPESSEPGDRRPRRKTSDFDSAPRPPRRPASSPKTPRTPKPASTGGLSRPKRGKPPLLDDEIMRRIALINSADEAPPRRPKAAPKKSKKIFNTDPRKDHMGNFKPRKAKKTAGKKKKR